MSGEVERWSLARRAKERIEADDLKKLAKFNECVLDIMRNRLWASEMTTYVLGQRLGLPVRKIMDIPDPFKTSTDPWSLDNDLRDAQERRKSDEICANMVSEVSDVSMVVSGKVSLYTYTNQHECDMRKVACTDPSFHTKISLYVIRTCDKCNNIEALGEKQYGESREFKVGDPSRPIYREYIKPYVPEYVYFPWHLDSSDDADKIIEGIGERLSARHFCAALPQAIGSPAPPQAIGALAQAGYGYPPPSSHASPPSSGQGAPWQSPESPIEVLFRDAHETMMLDELDGLMYQYEVHPYRLDFALPRLGIAIELDGYEWHSSRAAFVKDRQRQRDLEMNGWQVIRFAGSEVKQDPQRCVMTVAAYVRRRRQQMAATPPPGDG